MVSPSIALNTSFIDCRASGATWALLYGEEEAASGELSLKHLRDPSVGQVKLLLGQVAQHIGANS